MSMLCLLRLVLLTVTPRVLYTDYTLNDVVNCSERVSKHLDLKDQ